MFTLQIPAAIARSKVDELLRRNDDIASFSSPNPISVVAFALRTFRMQ